MSNLLRNTIERLSQEFLLEAENSPHLFADMAAMESYMAESYGERVFIEMLQNADDAQSTAFYVCEVNGHVFIANNGKPFDDKDVRSICRSGASEKKRGETIGYRGVGFKSTTHLSKNIYIHSNECTFTFSKSLVAERLGEINENKVPTIRIPFLLESLDADIAKTLNQLKQKGFTTIFIFCNSNLPTFSQEVQSVTADYFLFLRHISNIVIDVDGNQIVGSVIRTSESVKTQFNNRKYRWKIFNSEKAQIALALNEKQEIVPCRKEEAVFHCYLPTYEPSPYLFKINSDFSTDPSRKHITLDNRTEEALIESANLLFEALKVGVYSNNINVVQLIELIMQKNTFAKVPKFFEKQFQSLIQTNWLQMQDGKLISPKDYIKKSQFLNDSEWNWIRQHTPLKHTLPKVEVGILNALDNFVKQYTKDSYSINEWISMLSTIGFVEKAPDLILNKLYANLFKNVRNKILIAGEEFDISGCYYKNNDIPFHLSEASKDVLYMLLLDIKDQLTSSEIEWFIKMYDLETAESQDSFNLDVSLSNNESSKVTFDFSKGEYAQQNVKTELLSAIGNDIKVIKKSITRWRAAEHQCVEFEEMQGNIAKDVSKQNLGYDVVSVTSDKIERYIEVKSVKSRGAKISMTNNEYTAAHINGDNYFLCIIYEENNDVVFEYIQNPLENLKLEKVVRQWEWACEEYEGNIFKVSSEVIR
ncbi:Uncharacterized protein BWINRASL_00338 [Bacillus mycoides]|nr:hypothetical protein IEQ_00247 [Bacillus cereus BAG6X1-2]SCM91840.1 Uncharacterized protein BWINRASL_00338 [Bacillus mycoides]